MEKQFEITLTKLSIEEGRVDELKEFLSQKRNDIKGNFECLLNVAIKANNKTAAALIIKKLIQNNNLVHDLTSSINLANILGHLWFKDLVSPIGSPVPPLPPRPPRPFHNQVSRDDEQNNDSAIINQENTLTREIRVVPGSDIPYSDNVYKCLSTPRGAALILNYKDFFNPIYGTRRGSERDVCNLDITLSQMGYHVTSHMNLTDDLTEYTLEQYRHNKILSEVDSLLVFVMSHGIGKTTFITTSGEPFDISKVRNKFTNKNCPSLKGKPKLFFFVFCRGFHKETQSFIEHDSTSKMECDYSSVAPRDMLSMYSTVEGFVSLRDPNHGTPFICTVCDVLASKSHNSEIEELRREIQRKLGNTIEIENLGFVKKFYFNPIGYPKVT